MATRSRPGPAVLEGRKRWFVVAASFLTLLLVRGTVASYGNFIAPIEADLGWSRTGISLTFALFLVSNAVAAPVTGRLIDRHGASRTVAAFVAVVAVALVALSVITSLFQYYALYAVIGFCVTAASLTHVSSIVTKWFERRALLASAVAMSGVSVGKLVFNPVAAELILSYDWRFAYRAFGLLTLATVPLALFLMKSPPGSFAASGSEGASSPPAESAEPTVARASEGTAATTLSGALRTRSLWILVGSFAICGFTTVGLITTHLVPYLVDVGFSSAAAAEGAGVLGGMTVFGLLAAGALGDRYSAHKRPLLSSIYFLRGLTFLFLLTVTSVPQLLAFAAVFGLFYLGTVPLHTGLTADLFGKQHLTTLVGVQFAGHQLGGATAAFVAGWIFDVQGSYRWAHLLGLGLLVVAAGLVLAEGRLHRTPAAAG